MKHTNGISLITLIITIIVIIILAAIVIFTGLNTPDRAQFAKFTQEFSGFQEAVMNAFLNEKMKLSTSGQYRTDAQIYYKIATGTDTTGTPTSSGTVRDLTFTTSPEAIQGQYYYKITRTEVEGMKPQQIFSAAGGDLYITDKGEVFAIPGYLVEDNGINKWYVNASKYYMGEATSITVHRTLAPDEGKEELIFTCDAARSSNYVEFQTEVDVGDSFTVDWGDGTETQHSSTGNVSHTYSSTGVYDIKVWGDFKYFRPAYSLQHSLVEIKQWGTTGLITVFLWGCENLATIAEPTESSFLNLEEISFGNCSALTTIPSKLFAVCPNLLAFHQTFTGCTELQTIPEDLFVDCVNVTSFQLTFEECTSLTSIPPHLFDTCQEVTEFSSTFSGCTSLTGTAIPLWNRVENGASNDYQGIPDGCNCYFGCTGLSDYGEIPSYWKEEEVQIDS